MHQHHHHHHEFHYFPHGDNLMAPSLHLLHSRCQPICSSAILTIWVSASIQCSVGDCDYILPETRPKCLALATEGRALFYDLSTTGNKLDLWLIVGAVGHSSLMGCWRVLSGFAQWADAWFTIYMPAPHSQRWGVRGFSYTEDRATAIWWAGEGEEQMWKWEEVYEWSVRCHISTFFHPSTSSPLDLTYIQ